MYKALSERIKQGYRTNKFPKVDPVLSNRYQGVPVIHCGRQDCTICRDTCPTEAIIEHNGLKIDLGKCLFCGECAVCCPDKQICFSSDFKMAASVKSDLVIGNEPNKLAHDAAIPIQHMFKHSLKLRVVSAGGCNACEADVNVLSTIGFDLGRFGIQIVASPRHADGLLVIGPVTANMETAVIKTYEAIPDPKIVIAVGACAISGGIYQHHPEQKNGVDSIVTVDLYIPGCPPSPYTILDGLLRLLGKTG